MTAGLPDAANGPRYELVRQDLLLRIQRGEFNPGDRLPSEMQICTEYGVSVTTARRALQELVKDGIVFRQAGVGTMVAPRLRHLRLTLLAIGYVGGAMRSSSTAMGELIAGAGELAWQRDAVFSMTGLHEDEATEHLRRLVRERAVDGVLLRPERNASAEHLDILDAARMPYVVIKRYVPGRDHNCVLSDDVRGGWLATKHLLDLGHRRIGIISARPDLTTSRERLEGYHKALSQRGVSVSETLLRTDLPDFLPATGSRAVAELLGGPEPPTALFVASDTLAIGCYDAIRDAGLTVGGDVAVVGYDDIPTAGLLSPPLTTVRTSNFDFGQIGTELLLDVIAGRATTPARRVIAPTLVVRESAGEGRPGEAVTADQPDRPPAVRLAGQVLTVAGTDSPARRAITRRIETEGGHLITEQLDSTHGTSRGPRTPDGSSPAPPRTQTLVTVTDLGGAVASFDEILAMSHAAARQLAEQGGGQVLLVVSLARRSRLGPIDRLAARAGLTATVSDIQQAHAPHGVRMNAILHTPAYPPEADLSELAGIVAFLASADATRVDGQVLSLG